MAINYKEDISHIKEIKFLEEESARRFLSYWFRVNDGLTPNYISREEFEKKRKGKKIFEKDQDDERITLVNIPTDLQMWEIFDFVRLIDIDTFQDNKLAKVERDKLKQIITSYRNIGIYLTTYINRIDWGEDVKAKQLAIELATEFYRFSRYLQFRGKREITFEDIPNFDLTKDQRAEVEPLIKQSEIDLLGKQAVEKRYNRLQKTTKNDQLTDEAVDQARQKVIKAYFQALVRDDFARTNFDQLPTDKEKANQDLSWNEYVRKYLGKEDDEITGEVKEEKQRLEADFLLVKPWEQYGPAFALQQNAEVSLRHIFTRPKQELEKAVVRRGKHLLEREMKEAPKKEPKGLKKILKVFGLNFEKDQQRLFDKLEIEKLKNWLDEERAKSSPERVSQVELEIVSLIQDEISKYEYLKGNSLTVMILDKEEVNCVGASLLASVMLEAVGIKYLEAGFHEHSIIVVITDNGQFFYRDMRDKFFNKQLTDQELGKGNLEKLQRFVDSDDKDSVSLNVSKDWHKHISYASPVTSARRYLDLYKVDSDLSFGMINNLSFYIKNEVENNFEQVETLGYLLEEYLALYPESWDILVTYIDLLISEGFLEDAKLGLYRIDQVAGFSKVQYELWGDIFVKEDKFELALESYRYALIAYPRVSEVWQKMITVLNKLGRKGELITCLSQAYNFTNDISFKLQLIDILKEVGDFSDAYGLYNNLINEYPDDNQLWLGYYQLRILDEPNNLSFRLQLVKFFKDLEEISSAVDTYDEFIDQYPNDEELWLDYYKLTVREVPSKENCRLALEGLERFGKLEYMLEIIKIVKEESTGDLSWIDKLAKEFNLVVAV